MRWTPRRSSSSTGGSSAGTGLAGRLVGAPPLPWSRSESVVADGRRPGRSSWTSATRRGVVPRGVRGPAQERLQLVLAEQLVGLDRGEGTGAHRGDGDGRSCDGV